MSNVDYALAYLRKGLSVIPIKLDRAWAIQWKPYQTKLPTENEVKSWWANNSMPAMAIITGALSGMVVVDVDSREALELIRPYFNPEEIRTPIARTPRKGWHFYFKHPGIELRNKVGFFKDVDFRGDGGCIIAPPSHCEYTKHGQEIKGDYIWVQSLDDSPLAELPQLLIPVIKSFDPYKSSDNQSEKLFGENRKDVDLFHAANCLVKGGMEPRGAEDILNICVNSWGENDPKWVADKVRSALERARRKDRNLKEDVKDWLSCAPGIFDIKEIFKSLHINDRQSEKNVSDYLKDFQNTGIIERYGTKRGIYRPVEVACEPIELVKSNSQGIDLRYPMGVEKLCKTYPKNIIVVAGEPNAGKTAFLLNFGFLNMSQHEIHYFSSEMGQDELVARVEKFEISLPTWKVKFWDRAGDFHDVLRPDAINIIDFLEIHEDFWRVGAMIKKIYDKLDKGIAVIALQKNPTKKDKAGNEMNYLGLSGYRGAEKARIYLTMGMDSGAHVLHIAKGKNWQQQNINPNRMERRFKISGGCLFHYESDWGKREAEEVQSMDYGKGKRY